MNERLNGYSPQRNYKKTTDLNSLQMVCFSVPILLMMMQFIDGKVHKNMMPLSLILILIFVVLCFIPSRHNHGKKMIISVYYGLIYILRRFLEKVVKKL